MFFAFVYLKIFLQSMKLISSKATWYSELLKWLKKHLIFLFHLKKKLIYFNLLCVTLVTQANQYSLVFFFVS